MTRRVASLDIGSNTTLCYVADVFPDGSWAEVADYARVTGLGRGLTAAGLHPESRLRTWTCLKEFAAVMGELGVRETVACATAAMRDAVDGPSFAASIQRDLGIAVEIISGVREAELTWMSVAGDFPKLVATAVVDVGGRSTEIMSGTLLGPEAKVSLPIGTVSGTEQFLTEDPVSEAQIRNLRSHIRRLLKDVLMPPSGTPLVGVASTVTTFAAMVQALEVFDASRVHRFRLTLETLQAVGRSLQATPVAERSLCHPGLEPARAQVIVAGGILVEEVMGWMGAGELLVSNHGLRHGLMAAVARGLLPAVPFSGAPSLG